MRIKILSFTGGGTHLGTYMGRVAFNEGLQKYINKLYEKCPGIRYYYTSSTLLLLGGKDGVRVG